MREIEGIEAEKFTQAKCVQVATDDTGWEILYKLVESEEYWLMTYPHSEQHGGGSPILTPVTKQDAYARFNL